MPLRLFSRKPITKLSLTPPDPLGGRFGVCLVLIVRNEARHIGEWARFHKAAGVRHVVVYDNGCSDGTIDELRQALGKDLTVIPWDQKLRDGITGREIHNQVLAYAHAIRNFGGKYRWMACIDADEFLVPKSASSLDEALAHLSECGNISLPWHNYGRSGHQEAPAGGILQSYLRRAADPASGARGVSNFKVIVDPCRVTSVKVHSYETDGGFDTWNDRGQRAGIKSRSDRAFYSADHIQLNHYYTRSEEELARKIARGSNQVVDADRHAARVRRNVDNIERDETEDRCALDFLARIGATDTVV